MNAAEPFDRKGGGPSGFLSVELCSVGVEGLLLIFPQDAVAGRAEFSSSLSS